MAKINRGTVAVGRVPQGDSYKIRPVVVVQNDKNNARLLNVIAAMVTSNTRLALQEPTQVLVDMALPANKRTGLLHTSAIKCENLYTIPQSELRAVGSMPSSLMQKVDAALKNSLDLE
jgi:mRNA-degrading endonuclease toxin of MazEF toxin-antitoxin module